MNTGRKMMTRETKYSEKNLALEQNNALQSSSQLQLTRQKGVAWGPCNKKGCDLQNFRASGNKNTFIVRINVKNT
jgi:Tfp pilus tip-associated adhesin PilY1